jgi:hypothetical protein
VDFSLLDTQGGSGWSGVSEDRPDGILSAFENLGVNLAAAAGTVGIQALGKNLGVSSMYTNPAAISYNSALLTQRPGTVSPVGAALGVSGNALLFGGVLLVGRVMFAAFRRR